jgi:hypothetical protein
MMTRFPSNPLKPIAIRMLLYVQEISRIVSKYQTAIMFAQPNRTATRIQAETTMAIVSAPISPTKIAQIQD